MSVINLIATPRNLSTALMYSFAQRKDTVVVDEPFYAYYLERSGAQHPGREEVLASMEKNPARILALLLNYPSDKPFVFIKNMAHHIADLPLSNWVTMEHIFLIRDPYKLISSYATVIAEPTMADIGIDIQHRLYLQFKRLGLKTWVLDSDVLLDDPRKTLSELCERFDMPFDEAMLSWEAGPLAEDGVWAKYWYGNVHKSTGFKKQRTSSRELPEHCRALYEECLPFYRAFFNNETVD